MAMTILESKPMLQDSKRNIQDHTYLYMSSQQEMIRFAASVGKEVE
jgi:hypothetical protein